jgi:hypothetical protein
MLRAGCEGESGRTGRREDRARDREGNRVREEEEKESV